ncbi:MAG: hypothetical protein JNM78_12490 [Cyclobacteriaceae bacterium]|nr:hypothetical protein [Cyclobacteriaceae bacterium]
MNSPTQYEYSDGSANRYVITETTLEYIPVKPEESSTGMYSGGEPKLVSITNDQYKTVASLFETAFENTSAHMTERPKMSGLIVSITGSTSHQAILKPDSVEKKNIEEALKKLLQ